MLEETTIIKSKAIFSDDKEHRLLLRKEWDSEKPTAMVIMINPNTADTVNFDMTTMLVLMFCSSTMKCRTALPTSPG